MFMHGGLGADHSYFPHAFNQLGDDYELIYYDHRGNGRSRPVDLTGATHATWAEDADALRQHLGHDKMVLIGHSYGGFLAQEYALRFADNLDGLILLCTAPALDYPEVLEANAEAKAKSQAELDAVDAAFSDEPIKDDAQYEAMMGNLESLYFHNYEAFKDQAHEMMKDMQFSAAAWNHVSEHCLPDFDMVPHLSKVNTPTLIVSGAHDWVTPVAEGGQRIHDQLPNSELVVFEQSGHYPFIEENERFFNILRDWLNKL